MTRLDGHEIWTQDFAGVGSVMPDGSLAMVIGTNESPKWDHWEYRRVAASGKVEQGIKAEGRSAMRPLCVLVNGVRKKSILPGENNRLALPTKTTFP